MGMRVAGTKLLDVSRVIVLYIKRVWTEVHVRIIPQGDSAWLCADKSAGMRVIEE